MSDKEPDSLLSNDQARPEEEFPLAKAKDSAMRARSFGLSKMWLVTLACLVLAVGLVWYSVEDSGPQVNMHFKQGYGLKSGDAVRHRGIDIGKVKDVRLSDDLSGITVVAELKPSAEGVARAGARFWIVRPRLDVTGVSGLETAVGSKYIAVVPSPMPSPVFKDDFVGLESQPVDQLGEGGLELVLRGDKKYGVSPGSPVTWRGIEVGEVVSSTLSPDALYVDTRIRIEADHQRLVTRQTKFWSSSGIHVDVGVSGVEIDLESLSTIARGGVAFITPGEIGEDTDVHAGDIFVLHEEEDDSWTEEATAIDLLEVHPPSIVQLKAVWKKSLLGFARKKQKSALGILIGDPNAPVALVPTDFVVPPTEAIEGSFGLLAIIDGREVALASIESPGEQRLASLPLRAADGKDVSLAVSKKTRFRVAEDIEDCFAVRTSGADSHLVLETIGKHELTVDEGNWRWSKNGLSSDVWHGAPVVSTADEKIVGILSLSDDHTMVIPINAQELGRIN